MNLTPKITQKNNGSKFCPTCQQPRPLYSFLRVKSPASLDGYTEECGNCAETRLRANGYSWDILDAYCRFCNIPWIPDKFEEIRKTDQATPFQRYATIFNEAQYDSLNWKEYYEEFKKLESTNLIDQELPIIREERFRHLQEKWGANYSEEQLTYLENLYNGVLLSQNVNGDLAKDQAKKLCKTSLEIDERIRSGQDYDKMLASYEKLVKIAEFTPKNAKNAADFDSTGELFHWLEKRGWVAKFYDNVSKDVVDETMTNIQSSNRYLYTHESGIGEEITKRIEQLRSAAELENHYDIQTTEDLDSYSNDGFDGLFKTDEEFKEVIE